MCVELSLIVPNETGEKTWLLKENRNFMYGTFFQLFGQGVRFSRHIAE